MAYNLEVYMDFEHYIMMREAIRDKGKSQIIHEDGKIQ